MAATAVSICSNGLLELGAKPFSDFSEAGDHVTLCANLYPSIRDHNLRAHPWKFARKRVLLSPLNSKPEFDFAYQFQLPSDWERNLQVGHRRDQIDYRMEGRRILSNAASLPLVYIFRNEVPGTWNSSFVRLMELAMAAALAYPVTASTSLAQLRTQLYENELKRLKAIDGLDDPPEEFGEGSFVESRFT